MDYTHEYSNFPSSPIAKKSYKDVNDTIGSTINEIKRLQDNGRYSEAAQLIESVKDYVIGAADFNAFIEGLRNTQLYAKSAKQFIYLQSEDPTASNVINENDVWIE